MEFHIWFFLQKIHNTDINFSNFLLFVSTQGENKEENYIQTIEELNHDFFHECKQTFRGLRERNLFDFSNINNHACCIGLTCTILYSTTSNSQKFPKPNAFTAGINWSLLWQSLKSICLYIDLWRETVDTTYHVIT